MPEGREGEPLRRNVGLIPARLIAAAPRLIGPVERQAPANTASLGRRGLLGCSRRRRRSASAGRGPELWRSGISRRRHGGSLLRNFPVARQRRAKFPAGGGFALSASLLVTFFWQDEERYPPARAGLPACPRNHQAPASPGQARNDQTPEPGPGIPRRSVTKVSPPVTRLQPAGWRGLVDHAGVVQQHHGPGQGQREALAAGPWA